MTISLRPAPVASTTVDQGCELVILDNDRFDLQPCLEANFLQSMNVRDVGESDKQLGRAALVQRNNALGSHDLGIQRALRDMSRVELMQVEHRVAEGFQNKLSQLAGRYLPALQQLFDKCGFCRYGGRMHGFSVCFGDAIMLYQQAGETWEGLG